MDYGEKCERKIVLRDRESNFYVGDKEDDLFPHKETHSNSTFLLHFFPI